MALPFLHLVCAPREGYTMMLTLGTHSREQHSPHPCMKLHIIPTWMFTELSLKSNSPLFFVAIRSLKLNSLIFSLTFKDAPCKVESQLLKLKVSLNFFSFFLALEEQGLKKLGTHSELFLLEKLVKGRRFI